MVTENIYIIFDPEGTGLIGFDQLLLAFSMSMKGTGEKNYRLNFLYHYCIGSQPLFFTEPLKYTSTYQKKIKGCVREKLKGV